MASNAAVPFWRVAGMTYTTYSKLCANLVRQCLKEPYRSEALSREKVHFTAYKWVDGKPQKPSFPGSVTGETSWAEVVGLTAEEAERKIKEEMAGVKIQVVPHNACVTMDYQLNRVRIFVDSSGKVTKAPRIG